MMTYLIDDLEVEGDGLLAEDGLASLRRRRDLSRVLVGGGADHHGLHVRVVDELNGIRTQRTGAREKKKVEQQACLDTRGVNAGMGGCAREELRRPRGCC